MKALYGIMTCSVFVATLTPRRPVALACTGHGSTRQLYQFQCTVRLVSASLYCHFSMFCVSYWVFSLQSHPCITTTQGNKKQKIQIFGPLLYFCRAAERFVSCFLHILECRVGWYNYPNLEFLCNNLQAFPHMCQKHNRAYNSTFTGVTVAFLVWFSFVCLFDHC